MCSTAEDGRSIVAVIVVFNTCEQNKRESPILQVQTYFVKDAYDIQMSLVNRHRQVEQGHHSEAKEMLSGLTRCWSDPPIQRMIQGEILATTT